MQKQNNKAIGLQAGGNKAIGRPAGGNKALGQIVESEEEVEDQE